MLAAVCCHGADSLALFDVDTGDERGVLPVGSHPVHATVVDGRVLVATMGDRAVTVVDTDGSVRTVATGVLGPSHVATSRERIFVPCTAGDVVAVLDRAATSLVDRIPVGAEPHEIDVRDGTGVVGSRRDGCVTVFDTVDGVVRGQLAIAGERPRVQGVEAVALGEVVAVYATDQRNARIWRFDLESDESLPRAATASAAVGADPYDLTVAEDRIYVPSRDDGTVHELDLDLEPVAVHPVGGRPTDVLLDGDRRWFVDRGESRFGLLEGDDVEVPFPAITARETGNRRYILSHYDDDAVSLVDARAGTVVWTRETPAHPFGTIVV